MPVLQKAKNMMLALLKKRKIAIPLLVVTVAVVGVVAVIAVNLKHGNNDDTKVENNVVSGAFYTDSSSSSSEVSSASEITSSQPAVIAVDNVSLDKTSITLNKGETATLKSAISPDNATDTSITWSSTDIYVASVQNGVVTAVDSGSCVIKATTTNGKTAICNVTVKKNTPTNSTPSSNQTTPATQTPAPSVDVPQISGSATLDEAANMQVLASELKFNASGTGASYSPFGQYAPSGTAIIIEASNPHCMSITLKYWDGNSVNPETYKTKPTAEQLLKFYFGTAYSSIVDNLNTIAYGTDSQAYSILNHQYTISGRQVYFQMAQDSVQILFTEPNVSLER